MTFCRQYTKRDNILLGLGYFSYKEYLNSELWAEIRDAVLARDSDECRLCEGRAQVVHHLSYHIFNLSGESLRGLISLCHRCHKRLEFTPSGKKNTLAQANNQFGFAMRRKHIKRKRPRRRS